MILEAALILAFLATFGLFLGCVAVAMISGQRSDRREVERLVDEFQRLSERYPR